MNYLLHQLIDTTAACTPEQEAIRFKEQCLSYSDLSRRSNQLAHALVANGISRRDRVGIYMNKGLETAIAMYGIMKAGAVYVPLDPALPVERLLFVLQDCCIRCLITDSTRLKILRSVVAKTADLSLVIGLDSATDLPCHCISWDQVAMQPSAQAPQIRIIEQDLAYIIYTSGSTGLPKGIMHTHHSGLSFARWAAAEYALQPSDRLSNHAPLHFDLSIFDFFAGAVAQACVVIIPEPVVRFPASYSKLLEEQKITVLFTVPFALIQLLLHGVLDQRNLSALRWIIFGGEPFPTKHLRALMEQLSHVTFDNMYGPAEVNGVTHYTLTESPVADATIPIGGMSAIAESLVVGSDDMPVSVGEVGELLVRSPTMMQGYWNRPDLNERAFYYRPLFDGYQDTFYRTCDLVRQHNDGCFEFLGRKDRQIKVRGYRIELDEVEFAICADKTVKEAAAFTVPGLEGSLQIQAAVLLKQGAETNSNVLLASVKSRLPAYALPENIVILAQFPRTSTGKIDRRALRETFINQMGEH